MGIKWEQCCLRIRWVDIYVTPNDILLYFTALCRMKLIVSIQALDRVKLHGVIKMNA